MPSRISWHSTPCPSHWPFVVQTSGKPNHVPYSRPSSTACTKPRAHTQPITYNTIPQKDNMIPYMAQSRYPLNSQVLAIFFPFATIPATPRYLLLTDRHSPQYGMFMFSLHFMTNTFFLDIRHPFPPPLHFHFVSESYSQSNPIHATIPDPSYIK